MNEIFLENLRRFNRILLRKGYAPQSASFMCESLSESEAMSNEDLEDLALEVVDELEGNV